MSRRETKDDGRRGVERRGDERANWEQDERKRVER